MSDQSTHGRGPHGTFVWYDEVVDLKDTEKKYPLLHARGFWDSLNRRPEGGEQPDSRTGSSHSPPV